MPEQFEAWGWRVPFFISVLLVIIGLKIRTSISETPAFAEIKQQHEQVRVPLKEALKSYSWHMFLAGASFIANILAGYLLIGYLLSYTSNSLGMDSGPILLLLMLSAVVWIVFTVLGGIWPDRFGRKNTMIAGYVIMGVWAVPLFLLINTQSVWAFTVAFSSSRCRWGL